MPQVQELVLQSPTMMCDYFFVEKRGEEYQDWYRPFYDGDEIEFYLEDENAWLKGVVHSWYTDDGSGNAPGANAHSFIVITRDDKKYKYKLHAGLRVRLEAPTDSELMDESVWCEGGDWEGRWNAPADWVPCSQKGQKFIAPSGQACWYCDEHKPEWARKSDVNGKDFMNTEEPVTYSLEVALQISAIGGAIFQTDREHIRIAPFEDWRIWHNGQITATCYTAEACIAWLRERWYPLEQGWLPELPLYVADGENWVDFRKEKEERGQ